MARLPGDARRASGQQESRAKGPDAPSVAPRSSLPASGHFPRRVTAAPLSGVHVGQHVVAEGEPRALRLRAPGPSAAVSGPPGGRRRRAAPWPGRDDPCRSRAWPRRSARNSGHGLLRPARAEEQLGEVEAARDRPCRCGRSRPRTRRWPSARLASGLVDQRQVVVRLGEVRLLLERLAQARLGLGSASSRCSTRRASSGRTAGRAFRVRPSFSSASAPVQAAPLHPDVGKLLEGLRPAWICARARARRRPRRPQSAPAPCT